MTELELKEQMAELGFYNLHLMKGCVLCTFRNYQTDGNVLSEAGIMLYVKEERIEIQQEWIGGCVDLELSKLNKAFELIKEFYSEKKGDIK